MIPAFPYCGGKSRHAPLIASLCDEIPHTCYIEPFCGAASVFFTKQQVKVNVLNDYNHNITAIFKALRDHPTELVSLLYKFEYSEDLFYEAHRELFRTDLHVVWRAAYHLFLLHAMCGRPHVKKIEDLPPKKQKLLQFDNEKVYGFIHGDNSGLQTKRLIGKDQCDKVRGNDAGTGFPYGSKDINTRKLRSLTGTVDKVVGCDGVRFTHGTNSGIQTKRLIGKDQCDKVVGCDGVRFTHGTNTSGTPSRVQGVTGSNSVDSDIARFLNVPEDFYGKYWKFISMIRRNCQIMNRDGMDLIRRIDKPGVLFYIDPPYEQLRSKESFAGIDHDELEKLLKNMKHAKWILSQYDTPEYNERYKDYRKVTKETKMSCTGGMATSPGQHKVTEAFWINDGSQV